MKKTVLSLLVCLALILVILLAGNAITIGDKLAAASPVLAWVFYLLLLGDKIDAPILPVDLHLDKCGIRCIKRIRLLNAVGDPKHCLIP